MYAKLYETVSKNQSENRDFIRQDSIVFKVLSYFICNT